MKTLSVTIAMLIVGLWLSTATLASDDYLQDFPTLEHVMAETRGSDELDTAARQAASFNILSDAVVTLAPGGDAPGGGSFSAKETTLHSLYKNAELRADMVAYRILDPKNIQNDARNKWNKHRDEYLASSSFRDGILRFLPQEQRESYAKEFKKRVSELKALRAKRIALGAKEEEASAAARDLAARARLSSQLAPYSLVFVLGGWFASLCGMVSVLRHSRSDFEAVGRSKARWLMINFLGLLPGLGFITTLIYFIGVWRHLPASPPQPQVPSDRSTQGVRPMPNSSSAPAQKTCSSCHGSGRVKCHGFCNRGRLTCPTCSGRGGCSTCSHTGTIACSTCGGRGEISCSACGGSGSRRSY